MTTHDETQTPAPEDLDSFEARLLTELRAEVADSDRAPAARPWRRALAAGAGVAATAVVGVLLVPGLGTTAAYSVQEGNSGEITVEVNRPEDAPGLEDLLAEHGVVADITYLAWPQQCAEDRYVEVPQDRLSGMSTSIGSDLLRVTIPPGAVREGDTFVLSLSYREIHGTEGGHDFTGNASSVSFGVAQGRVAPCDPVTTER